MLSLFGETNKSNKFKWVVRGVLIGILAVGVGYGASIAYEIHQSLKYGNSAGAYIGKKAEESIVELLTEISEPYVEEGLKK